MQVKNLSQEGGVVLNEEDRISSDTGPLFKLLFDDASSKTSSQNTPLRTFSGGTLYQHTTDLGSVKHFLVFNKLPLDIRGFRRIKEYQIGI